MFWKADDIEAIAEKLIEERTELDHIEVAGWQIDYLYSDWERKVNGNPILADIRKVTGIMKHYCDYDFIITVYEPNIMDFPEEKLPIVVFHELLHIGTDGKLIDHDIKDFRLILEEYGLNWQTDDLPITGGDDDES